MNNRKKAALERAGFQIGDAADFLDLSAEERRLVDLRVAVCRAVRRVRVRHRLTQQELADRLQSSQSRVAKLEAGAAGVSLDLLFRGLFAAGGRLTDVTMPHRTARPRNSA
jgi:ribosome-binding protein aMBF1 (putative translation factor)